MGNTILAKGVNHILAKRDNSAWPKGAKLSGFSTIFRPDITDEAPQNNASVTVCIIAFLICP